MCVRVCVLLLLFFLCVCVLIIYVYILKRDQPSVLHFMVKAYSNLLIYLVAIYKTQHAFGVLQHFPEHVKQIRKSVI